MRSWSYGRTAYGISDKLADGYWLIGIICGLVFLITAIVLKPEKWYLSIFISMFIVWGAPVAILISIGLLENLIWGMLHPKLVYKNILIAIGVGFVLVISGWISFQIPQFAASHFAVPNSSTWEFAYVSESPNAHCYHYSEDCTTLQNTLYNIEMLTVENAENLDYEPCKVCLKEAVCYQWNDVSCFLFIPISWLLFLLINLLIKKQEHLTKTFKLRNPLVKRFE